MRGLGVKALLKVIILIPKLAAELKDRDHAEHK
jgi:hypothetical protein